MRPDLALSLAPALDLPPDRGCGELRPDRAYHPSACGREDPAGGLPRSQALTVTVPAAPMRPDPSCPPGGLDGCYGELSRSRQLSATTAYRPEIALAVLNHQDRRRPRAHPRQRVVAEVLAVLSDRGSESTSAACVDGCDRLGCGVPWAALGRAWITPSPSRYSSPSRSSSSTASSTAPAPKREPRSFAAVGERVTDHRPVLWMAGGGRTVIDPSAVRPPTLQTASASREPKGRAALSGQAATDRASMVVAQGQLLGNRL
jgi:hypothetical protein